MVSLDSPCFINSTARRRRNSKAFSETIVCRAKSFRLWTTPPCRSLLLSRCVYNLFLRRCGERKGKTEWRNKSQTKVFTIVRIYHEIILVPG
jgi:hypothetical protein